MNTPQSYLLFPCKVICFPPQSYLLFPRKVICFSPAKLCSIVYICCVLLPAGFHPAVSCISGFYSYNSTCTECAIGTYQNSTEETYCYNCTDSKTTLFTASDDESDCVGKEHELFIQMSSLGENRNSFPAGFCFLATI